MPLPKALLCALGQYPAAVEEAKLRQSGFATATLRWEDLLNQTNDWMQLVDVLDDEAVQAWVLAGEPADFSAEFIRRVSLLALALKRSAQPGTALVLCEEGPAPVLPPLLEHVSICHSLDPFAARLMAARFKPGSVLTAPMRVRPLLDPMIGLWLEVAPAEGGGQPDFLVGVLEAEITAFGVGPSGVIPARSTLAYPLLGVRGIMKEQAFSACAARNPLGDGQSCFCKVEGVPAGVFLGGYPDEGAEDVVPLLFS